MIKVDKKLKILNFYGIKFYNWSFDNIIKKIKTNGGYLVAPAASALCEIDNNIIYYKSLKNSNIAIFDSGFFCLLLRYFGIFFPKKLSGFLFLFKFLRLKNENKRKIFLVNSSDIQGKKNEELLKKHGFKNYFSYTAPIFKNNKFADKNMIIHINKFEPDYIIINIAGGKQEPLAYFINKTIRFKCSIFCLGAAIDFLNGLQAPINTFIDRIYLGWLTRILFNHNVFFKRVVKSIKLIKYFNQVNKN